MLDFLSTVNQTWKPSQLAHTITLPQSSGVMATVTPADFGTFSHDEEVTDV